jgi:hypothetical protein
MSKGFTVPLADLLAGDIGKRSIEAEWQALCARPDATPLPAEPARLARRFVPGLLFRLLTRASGSPPSARASVHSIHEASG